MLKSNDVVAVWQENFGPNFGKARCGADLGHVNSRDLTHAQVGVKGRTTVLGSHLLRAANPFAALVLEVHHAWGKRVHIDDATKVDEKRGGRERRRFYEWWFSTVQANATHCTLESERVPVRACSQRDHCAWPVRHAAQAMNLSCYNVLYLRFTSMPADKLEHALPQPTPQDTKMKIQ